jgi:hypothetical protein
MSVAAEPGASPLLLGTWARAGDMLGVVARVDTTHVTLFDLARRQQREVALDEIQVVPAAALQVTVRLDLPVPHGLDEYSLRRWTAMLIDPVLRERAADALTAAGLDEGVTLPTATVDVAPSPEAEGRCLCGATTPADAGVPVACQLCGRQAAPPVAPTR